MIEIVSQFERDSATDGDAGNLNDFLRSLIVEVVSENYRQALFEDLVIKHSRVDRALDLALRANERTMSGLFGFALGKVAGLTRPEVNVPREKNTPPEANVPRDKNARHVDFLAWYGNRVLAIELKAGTINVYSEQARSDVVDRWKLVVRQIGTAQAGLRKLAKTDVRMDKPISMALMVVPSATAHTPNEKWTDVDEAAHLKSFKEALQGFRPKPQFIAIYSAPHELRDMKRKQKSAATSGNTYYPFYGFIARTRVQG